VFQNNNQTKDKSAFIRGLISSNKFILQNFLIMKKNTIYISLLLVFIVAIAAIFYKYESNNYSDNPETYSLLPRKGATAQTNEWFKVKEQSYKLLETIRNDTKDTRSLIQLATLYIQEARVTGNYAYYDKAALK